MKNIRPPKFAEFLLLLFIPREDRDSIMADLLEDYNDSTERFGLRAASLLYWKEVITTMSDILVSPFFLFKIIASVARSILKIYISLDQSWVQNTTVKPPKFGRFLLKAFVPRERRANAIGDAEAEYLENHVDLGRFGAWCLYWKQIAVECWPALWRFVCWLGSAGFIRQIYEFFHKFVS